MQSHFVPVPLVGVYPQAVFGTPNSLSASAFLKDQPEMAGFRVIQKADDKMGSYTRLLLTQLPGNVEMRTVYPGGWWYVNRLGHKATRPAARTFTGLEFFTGMTDGEENSGRWEDSSMCVRCTGKDGGAYIALSQ